MPADTKRRGDNAPPPLLGHRGPGPNALGSAAPRAKDTRVTLGRLWQYLRQQKAALLVGAAIVVVTSGLSLLGPYLFGVAIDRYVQEKDLDGLLRICLLLLGIHLTVSFLTWIQGFVMARAAQRTMQRLRSDLFAALQRLPLRFYDTRQHGDLMSRMTNDIENVSQVLTDSVPSILTGLLTLVGSAAVMMSLNPALGAASIVVTSALTVLVGRWTANRTRTAFRAQQTALGSLNGYIEETISGQRVVKSCGREEQALERFDSANEVMRSAGTRAQMMAGVMGPFMNGINNLSLALIAGMGGFLAVRGLATVGTIAAFINYSRQFGRPLSDIANLYNAIQGAIAGAERAFEIIDEPPEVDAVEAVSPLVLKGDVEFDGVSFSYEPDTTVLRDVSLHARPGETIALIGPTGAGKTTIVNLLTRFYEIETGRILLDGRDIREMRKNDLRRQLGIVLQDSFLFNISVKENIRYGRLEATDEEVVEAAKLANAHTFIMRLPHGYDTPVSERGENLSQGQVQMLAIARAILADPRILILDEATSSVDTRSERHIQEAMRRLMQGRTSFVIAHRLSTIRAADQILVIDHGSIIERGTHTELMAQRGFYHRLTTGRFGEVKDEDEAETAAA